MAADPNVVRSLERELADFRGYARAMRAALIRRSRATSHRLAATLVVANEADRRLRISRLRSWHLA
jgi:hypothetical protein